MNKHNYTALTTFRGWSEEKGEWVYGSLVQFNGSNNPMIVCGEADSVVGDMGEFGFEASAFVDVHPDSIGVYTGEKDIFAAIGKYGGDIVVAETNEYPPEAVEGVVIYEDCEFLIEQDDNYWPLCSLTVVDKSTLKKISTQWEEHLKASQ